MKREESADRLSGVRNANNPARFCARWKPEIFQEFFGPRRSSGKAQGFASGVTGLGRFRPHSLPPNICPHSVTGPALAVRKAAAEAFCPEEYAIFNGACGGRGKSLAVAGLLSQLYYVRIGGRTSLFFPPTTFTLIRSIMVTIADTYPPTYAEFNVPSIAGTRFVIRKATDWTDFPCLRSALANRSLNSYRVLPI